jgi:hypothetical protein
VGALAVIVLVLLGLIGLGDAAGLRTDLSKALVPLEDIVSGGPAPDGIPPIDRPRFITPAMADSWLKRQEPVLALTVGRDVRAYPLQILMWHEIVNDVVGGQPVAVTFCPLCNSGIVFDRVVDGVTLDFGTSGKLYKSDLVMYDRQTHSLWAQMESETDHQRGYGVNPSGIPMRPWATVSSSIAGRLSPLSRIVLLARAIVAPLRLTGASTARRCGRHAGTVARTSMQLRTSTSRSSNSSAAGCASR